MAQQNSAPDPVSQAMLAIEDALNLGAEVRFHRGRAPESTPEGEAEADARPPPRRL